MSTVKDKVREKILIVEDEKDLVRLIRYNLEKEHFRVISANDAETGLDMARKGKELEAELISYCRSRLSAIKCPRSIDFETELPRTPTGKLVKRHLRDRYWPNTAAKI